jgi:peptidoglycan hydrolase-like protein with peptidoglycan-binding domain
MNVRTAAVRIAGPVVGAAVLATAIGVGTANASTTAPDIHNGTHGFGVECVQAGLDFVDNAGLAVDGVDGTLTTVAVKTFQRRNGLSVDGIVGPATGDILWQDIEADQPAAAAWVTCGEFLPTSY